MTPNEHELRSQIDALSTENARLRAILRERAGDTPRPPQNSLTTGSVGYDILSSAVEKTRMPMILTDPRQADDPIVFVNRAFLDLTGYGAHDLIGRNCRFLQGPDTDPEHLAQVREALAENRDVAVQIVNYRKDGSSFINDLYISPVFDDAGELVYRFANQRNVTETVKNSAALKISEQRYRTLFDTIDEGFCIIEFLNGPHGPDSDYRHIEANAAYTRHAGFPEIVGKRLREIVSPVEAEDWLRRYIDVLRTGESIHFEQELKATGRHLEVTSFRVEPAELRQVAVLFRDITARTAAEHDLRQLNETLEQRVAAALAERKVLADVVEGTDALVQVIDGDYRWLAINRAAIDAFERVFGLRPKVGDSVLDALAHLPEQRRRMQAVWRRALSGHEFTETAQFETVDRTRSDYEMHFGVLRDGRGQQAGAYQFAYDVSERLKEQARLFAAEDALRQSQKMEAVGQLTGGVAHDFNNLLTIIRSAVDFLRQPELAETRRVRYIDAVSETVDRAAKLTGQLLAFARRQTLKPEVFDVVAQVRSVADMLDTVTGSRVRVVLNVPDSPCFVNADVSQFETAIVNMAVNARDAMNNEGTLTLSVACHQALPPLRLHSGAPGPFTAIMLTDTGAGIEADVLERIFEPFYTTKGVGKGTGLGLSQVFGFAKQTGGDVGVRSRVGEGATFTLYVPQVPTEQVAEPHANHAFPTDARTDMTLSVLVVEDNVEVGRVATQILQDLGNRTVWAPTAEAALIELEKDPQRFDVVFSDVVMPGMGGIELARAVARRFPKLPIVLTSGYSEVLAQEGTRGFELIHKPYSAKEIAVILQRVVDQAKA